MSDPVYLCIVCRQEFSNAHRCQGSAESAARRVSSLERTVEELRKYVDDLRDGIAKRGT